MNTRNRMKLDAVIILSLILTLILLVGTTINEEQLTEEYRTLNYKVEDLKNEIEELEKIKQELINIKKLLEEDISAIEQEPKILSEEEQIDLYVEDICKQYNFDPYLVKSVIWHESRYDPKAKNTTHLGLMQVSTIWHSERADRLGVEDFYDPYGNILLGVDYLSEIANRYEDIRLVLMTYNMGDKRAKELFNEGEISWYATSVLERAEELKTGGD